MGCHRQHWPHNASRPPPPVPPNEAEASVWKQLPQEDGLITLEIYPIEVDEDSNSGLFQQWGGGTSSSDEPRKTDTVWERADTNQVRDRFRVAILWTNDTTDDTPPTAASEATNTSTDSLRFAAIECRIISHKTDFTNGILKVIVTLKL